ncbi:fungal-specific transcription factor domain-containing protein [Geopyxis carbonaria]|nr:fungal-specific transcription factor domain-containing protein [Geopyxis carbonaria]
MRASHADSARPRPICKHCQDFKISCYYADGKRDRAKTEMANLKQKVEAYEQLLDQLKPQVDSAGKMAITKVMQGSGLQRNLGSDSGSTIRVENRDGESLVFADVGSTGSIDHIREEINSDNTPYPTGYMGKSSEVAWIQRVAQQLAKEARHDSPLPGEVDDEFQFQTPAYHLDDLSVSITGGQIDPYLLPDKQIADELVNAFFNTVHPSFPVVLKKLFMKQYVTFFETFFPPGNSKRWLAILNLIFAIGTLYGKFTGSEWRGGDAEHLKYFGRARILSLDEGSIFEVADLQQVQVIGLAAMYLLSSNQTNRAWNVIGLAIRYAQTLGLNLRNDVPEFDEVEKEMRVRMWFALLSVEHLLCLMTGRPSAINERDCSVPLPRPVDEEMHGAESFDSALAQYSACTTGTPTSTSENQLILTPNSNPSSNTPSTVRSASNPGSSSSGNPPGLGRPMLPTVPPSAAAYFLEHIKLTHITHSVFSELYSPDTINRTWSDIQGIISALELRLVKWREDLPPFLDFGKHNTQQSIRERNSLAFQYRHARILINRPCLCRLDFRIPNESNRSRGFNRSGAAACIGAARETIAMLPDEPQPVALISVSPWWCLLHYLVAAGAILMVEISMRAEHNPQQAEGLLSDTKKVVRWLRSMSKDNIAAERSWAVLSKLLIVSAPKIGGDTSDVERDLDLSSNDNSRQHTIVSTSPGTGTIRGGDADHGLLPLTNVASPQPPMSGDIPYLFRGIFDHEEQFPFDKISMNTGFDNLLCMPDAPPLDQPDGVPSEFVTSSLPHSPPQQTFVTSHPDPGGIVFPIQGGHDAPPRSLLSHPPLSAISTSSVNDISDRSLERLQKRLSLGVSDIAIPPLPEFPTWSTGAHTGDMADSGLDTSTFAERGRADLDAATVEVGNAKSTNITKSSEKSRKRNSIAD